MNALRLILVDQLSQSITSLEQIDVESDGVLFLELMEEATNVPHHPKKIAFQFSAMRHFAAELEAQGLRVEYVKLDDPSNTGNLAGEINRAVAGLQPVKLVVTESGEYQTLLTLKSLQENLGIPVNILPDTRFLASHAAFEAWAKDKKQLRMEFFYREMRKRHSILMNADGTPTGGAWNFDKENRKPPKADMKSPSRISHKKSAVTARVLQLVRDRFSNHFGTLEPFHFAVTRKQALMELDHFIGNLLLHFGDYQDAMVADEPYLYHSLISCYLNAGLLLPLEICQKAEVAYRAEMVPLNAAEGFIRQILGWREYMRGIYWHFMPGYGERNSMGASRPLPDFYWTARTTMFCLGEAVRHTRDHAYSHHIQRLMITGNFALLAGLDVKQVQEWYLAVYADAYEWVEMPNTLGMALFGDGGVVASKPYAASGRYINRMSNYCKNCKYDPNEMTAENACPFNALYWDFLVRHEDKFRSNQRMAYAFSTWNRFAPLRQMAIRAKAASFFEKLGGGNL